MSPGKGTIRLAGYSRVSSLGQKEEETIQRQIDNFFHSWEAYLKDICTLKSRFPDENQNSLENVFFIDEAYNLETLEQDKAFYELLLKCQFREIDAIYVSEADRILRSRSRELRGKVLDILDIFKIRVFTKNCEISTNNFIMELTSAFGAEDKRAFMRKCHEGRIARVALATGKALKNISPEVNNEIQKYPMGISTDKIVEMLNSLGFNRSNYYKRNNFRNLIKKNPDGKWNEHGVNTLFDFDRYSGN